jgi:alpha-tubulin suppressor-like RCC1 family protein
MWWRWRRDRYHSLFVKTDGTLWAMGYNYYGQLGNGTTTDTNHANQCGEQCGGGGGGRYHSLFVTTDGTLWAMGYNGRWPVGQRHDDTNLPVSVASNVVAVAAGGYHSLFVKTDGTLWAMGYNYYGQLGNGTTTDTNLPISVASNVVAVAAGYYHSLFVKTDGYALGDGDITTSGQLGNGTTTATNKPISVPNWSWPICFPADQASHSLAIGHQP